jgi:hypothetical protein
MQGGVVVMVVQPGERNAYDQQVCVAGLMSKEIGDPMIRDVRCTPSNFKRAAD